jgi:uncharacterized protein
MIKYGLSEKHIEQIHQILKKYDVLDTAILYGSRAIGTYREGSDIDLTLKGNNLDIVILNRLYNDFAESLLPYKFDLSIFNMLANHDISNHIQRVGIIFYQKNK